MEELQSDPRTAKISLANIASAKKSFSAIHGWSNGITSITPQNIIAFTDFIMEGTLLIQPARSHVQPIQPSVIRETLLSAQASLDQWAAEVKRTGGNESTDRKTLSEIQRTVGMPSQGQEQTQAQKVKLNITPKCVKDFFAVAIRQQPSEFLSKASFSDVQALVRYIAKHEDIRPSDYSESITRMVRRQILSSFSGEDIPAITPEGERWLNNLDGKDIDLSARNNDLIRTMSPEYQLALILRLLREEKGMTRSNLEQALQNKKYTGNTIHALETGSGIIHPGDFPKFIEALGLEGDFERINILGDAVKRRIAVKYADRPELNLDTYDMVAALSTRLAQQGVVPGEAYDPTIKQQKPAGRGPSPS